MNKKSGVFKHTIKFMVSFVIFSILILILFAYILVISTFVRNDLSFSAGLVVDESAKPDQIDWDKVQDFGGYGFLVDESGNITESYKTDKDGQISIFDALDYGKHFNTDETMFAYDVGPGQKLLIIYPSDLVKLKATFIYDSSGQDDGPIFLLVIGAISLYILGTYLMIRRLYKNLKREQDLAYREENQRKDDLFKGLAHDMKTPLSSIIGYSQALDDGIIESKDRGQYYKKITKNGLLLKDRLNDMMAFSSLGDSLSIEADQADLLDHIRSYVADNYSWYMDRGTSIEILYEDEQDYIVNFDKKLIDRVLQNILQNSVHHNDGPVNISIDFKAGKIIFKDDGIGIEKEYWQRIFEPMFTVDESRAGDYNRGLGLANVKRIVEIHGWQIEYNERGFVIRLEK